jgi:RNA polymerase-binding transcription factor DksA
MATTKKSTKASTAGRKATPARATKPAAKGTSKAVAKKTPAKAAVRKTAAAPTKSAAKKAPAAGTRSTRRRTAAKSVAPVAATTPAHAAAGNGARGDHEAVPAPRGRTKDGIAYTKDFDAKFLKSQRDLLTAERQSLLGQADRLEDEANSLIEDGEMGDVQFDDESGEGDTMVVERERDLALSAQARQIVADIDAALDRMTTGTYGYSLVSGRPIPRERLEAIPWATELVEEKVGGIGRR